jgi:hypothetical protein
VVPLPMGEASAVPKDLPWYAGATSGLVAPFASLRGYCATTRLDLADCGLDPALLMAWTVNR